MEEYNIDPAFRDELRRIDPKLGWLFNGHHVVLTYRRATGQPVPIWVVRDDATGGFRHPDQRDLQMLQANDAHRETVNERLDRIASYMESTRAADKIRTKDTIRNITKDDKLQLMAAYNKVVGSGKGNSAFRRITPKADRESGVVANDGVLS